MLIIYSFHSMINSLKNLFLCSTALNQKAFEKIYVYEITKPIEKFGWNVASIVLDKVYI
jgi:hypothetical protein